MKLLALALFFSASLIVHAQVLRVDTAFGIRSQMQCTDVTIQNISGMASLEDGSVFAIGSFRPKGSEFATEIAKFDRSGMHVPELPVYTSLQRGYPIAIGQQESGRIIVAHSETSSAVFLGILGFIQSGVVDTTFSADSITGGYLQAMCIDSSDRIILGGRLWDTVNTTQYACTRLTKDGALDATFNRPVMKGRIVCSVAVDSLGRIYIGGSFDSISGHSRNGLARLTSRGNLDETFSVTLDSGSSIYNIVVQDGLGVVVRQYNSMMRGQAADIVRYTFDGRQDSTFGPYDTTGRRTESITSLPSGQLIVSGRTVTWAGSIERLNANGMVDTSFTLENSGQGQVLGVCPEPTGTLISYGRVDIVDRVYHQRMFRLDENGRVDHSYNANCGLDGMIELLQQLQNGSLFIGGSQVSYDTLPLGPSFMINTLGGIVDGYRQDEYPIDLLGRRSVVKSRLLANNALMVLDQTQIATDVGPEGLSSIYRLLPDGTRDAEYEIDSTLNNRIRTACFNEDGSAFIAGIFQTVDDVARQGIAKLNRGGKVDLSFDPGSGVDTAVFAIVPSANGTVIVGGAMSRYDGKPVNRVMRLLANGELDTTFTTTWTLEPLFGMNTASVEHVATDSKDNIVISGDFQSVNNIIYGNVVRLRSNGQLDRTFAMDLIASIDVNDLTVDHNDRPLIAGGSRVFRLNDDGSTDTTFQCMVNGSVRGISLGSRDTMYIYGQFDSVGTHPVQNIARLLINDNATSISEQELPREREPLSMRVYPNPVRERTTVEMPFVSGPYVLMLLDCTGRTVMETVTLTDSSRVIDVAGIPNGPYYVMVRHGGNVTCTSFIKFE